MSVEISRLDPTKSYFGRKQFDCGHAVINKFVRESLVAQAKKNLSVAYVLTDPSDQDRLIGFFTIAQHSIPCASLSSVHPGSLPRVVPCTRLVMLGVDTGHKGKDLGSRLMRHALSILKSTAQQVGTFGMYLDADSGAVAFYLKLGFVLLEGNKSPAESPMFLPLSSIP